MNLAPDEVDLVESLGFELEVARIVRSHSDAPIERLNKSHPGGAAFDQGFSIAIPDGNEAERLINLIQSNLVERGYHAFWSSRHAPNGLKTTDELVVLKTGDPFSFIRICLTNGANYGISNRDILDRLNQWTKIAKFDVAGASGDWVAITFSELPANICAFADEIYIFCPDAVTQGVGLMRNKDSPEEFAAARKLCPEIATKPLDVDESLSRMKERMSPEAFEQSREMMKNLSKASTSLDMGVRLLAYYISKTKFLFLWWD